MYIPFFRPFTQQTEIRQNINSILYILFYAPYIVCEIWFVNINKLLIFLLILKTLRPYWIFLCNMQNYKDYL